MHGCMDKVHMKLYFFAFLFTNFFSTTPSKNESTLSECTRDASLVCTYFYSLVFVHYSLYELSVTFIALNLWREPNGVY